MKFEFKNKELLTRTFDKYCAVEKKLRKYRDEVYKDVKPEALALDIRDFPHLVFFLNGMDLDMDEKTMQEKSVELFNEFKANPTKIINKVMDYYESFDLSKMDTTKESDLVKICMFGSLNQGFSRLLEFNPDYEESRYCYSGKKMANHDGYALKSTATNVIIQKAFNDELLSISKLDHISPFKAEQIALAFADESVFNKGKEEWGNNFRFSLADYYLNKTDTIELEVNNNWARIYSIVEGLNDPKKTDPIYGQENYYSDIFTSFENELFPGMTYIRRGIDNYDSPECYDNVYIDGKSLASLLDANFDKNDVRNYRNEATKLMADAMYKGKPIDVVQLYSVNGITETKVSPISFKYTKEAKDSYQQKDSLKHSWFRRTFFNWGPFKIKTDVNYDHVNEINAELFDERKEAIVNDFRNKHEDRTYENVNSRYQRDLQLTNDRTKDRFADFDEIECGGKALNKDLDQGFIYSAEDGITSNNTRKNIDILDDEKDNEVNRDFEAKKEVANDTIELNK